jgi:vacuolar protein sorting-associated protein 45
MKEDAQNPPSQSLKTLQKSSLASLFQDLRDLPRKILVLDAQTINIVS